MQWVAVGSVKLPPDYLGALVRDLRGCGVDALPPLSERTYGPGSTLADLIDWTARAIEGVTCAPFGLIGHSAGGTMLPDVLCARNLVPTHVLYMDCHVLEPGHRDSLAGSFGYDYLQTIADADERLPPWSEWTTPARWKALLPNPALRDSIERSMPRLPLSLFADRLRHSHPPTIPASYVALSRLHAFDNGRARLRRWPTMAWYDLKHLAPVTNPYELAQRLAGVLEGHCQ